MEKSILRELIEALYGGSGIFPGYNVNEDLPKEKALVCIEREINVN